MSQHTRSGWVVAVLLAVVVGGCVGPAVKQPMNEDPIRGGRPVPIAKTDTAAPLVPDANDPMPLPPSDGGKSPAALTSASQPPARPLDKVVPAAHDVSHDTYEQLQQQLRAHGIVRQTLRSLNDKDEWLFACFLPNPREPNMGQYFDAQVVGDNGLAAIRAVLADVEKHKKEEGW